MLDNKSEEKEEALRYNEGKLEWSLVDYDALEPMVQQLMFGSKKYSAENWKKGMKISKIFDSLQRHILAIKRGETHDKESGVHHAGGVLCNAMFLSWYLTTEKGQSKIIPDFVCVPPALDESAVINSNEETYSNGPYNREKVEV